MNRFLLVLTSILFCISCKKTTEEPKTTVSDYNPGTGWNLSWAEEFDATALNTSLWNYEIGNNNGWGNSELQYYKAENVALENGNLVITAKNEVYNTYSFTSGRINTKNKFSFNYGKIVGRIKMPEGYGMWPAFWMLGSSSQSWPACGEIDIAEMKCGQGVDGDKTAFSTCHWLNGSYVHEYYGKDFVYPYNLSQSYHNYEVEWNATSITARIDGTLYNQTDITTSDKSELKNNSFFIILNIAVGGTIFSPAITNPSSVTASFPQKMYVDWIRIYQK